MMLATGTVDSKIGVLLVNLGTPNSPSVADVYRYLIEFLTDARVIDYPWWQRQLLVRGIIVPSRCRQSARSYQTIWTEKGSPLKLYGYSVEKRLQELLGDEFYVKLAMRYQEPSLSEVLGDMQKVPLKKLIVLPLFPQYASATTGSVHQKVMEIVSKEQIIPETIFINSFATDKGFIDALCAVAEPFDLDSYDHILFSFHGLPKRQLLKADQTNVCFKKERCCECRNADNSHCYSAHCYATAKALAEALGLEKKRYTIAFQSRLGKDPWLEPFTAEVIHQLAQQGNKRVLVFCPSFVCDCLETLYEIGIEYAQEFKDAGGEVLELVPGLNSHPEWIKALGSLVKKRLGESQVAESMCASV